MAGITQAELDAQIAAIDAELEGTEDDNLDTGEGLDLDAELAELEGYDEGDEVVPVSDETLKSMIDESVDTSMQSAIDRAVPAAVAEAMVPMIGLMKSMVGKMTTLAKSAEASAATSTLLKNMLGEAAQHSPAPNGTPVQANTPVHLLEKMAGATAVGGAQDAAIGELSTADYDRAQHLIDQMNANRVDTIGFDQVVDKGLLTKSELAKMEERVATFCK